MAGTILVTGGTGYIGGEVIRQLLGRGWTVHTTVRSKAKSEAGLRQRFGFDTDGRFKVFEADLLNDDGWAEAAAGCSHVAHVASPVPVANPKDENDLIIPAREGTLRALRFAKQAGAQRFVQTSSVAAIAYGRSEKVYTVDESNWTDLSHSDISPYTKSKTIAERAARDWMGSDGGDMEFVSVNPALVLGPVESADFSASVQVVKQMLSGAIPLAPDLGFAIVDLRDVADLHVKCVEEPGLAGERFIAAGRFYKMIEVAQVIRDNLPPEHTGKVPTKVMPKLLAHVLALFNPSVRSIKNELGKTRNCDASHALERLGWKTRDETVSIVDCAKSLIEVGAVKV